MEPVQSIVFSETGNWTAVLKIANTTIDEPADGELQVKVIARPVNPSDEMFIKGVYRQQPVLPQIAGLEGAGIIANCGSSVDRSYIGKHVAFRTKGTWTEKLNIDLSEVRVIPENIEFEVACQLSLNTLTDYALLEVSAAREDKWVLLTAANSSVSQQIIQLASRRNINVIAVVRKDGQREKLEALGARVVINSEKEDLATAVLAHVPSGVHACIDAVGGSLGSQLFKIAAVFSRIIIYGRLSNDPVSFNNGDVIYRNLELKGFGIDAWMKSKTRAQLDETWQAMLSAVLDQKLIVGYDHVYPLAECSSAINDYKRSGSRIILK